MLMAIVTCAWPSALVVAWGSRSKNETPLRAYQTRKVYAIAYPLHGGSRLADLADLRQQSATASELEKRGNALCAPLPRQVQGAMASRGSYNYLHTTSISTILNYLTNT